MHQNGNHSFVAYLSDNEFGNLCRKLGIPPLPLDALSFYGLDLLDLGRDVLVAQAVPKMVQSFVRAQMKGESLDADSFLNYYAWSVGLHQTHRSPASGSRTCRATSIVPEEVASRHPKKALQLRTVFGARRMVLNHLGHPP